MNGQDDGDFIFPTSYFKFIKREGSMITVFLKFLVLAAVVSVFSGCASVRRGRNREFGVEEEKVTILNSVFDTSLLNKGDTISEKAGNSVEFVVKAPFMFVFMTLGLGGAVINGERDTVTCFKKNDFSADAILEDVCAVSGYFLLIVGQRKLDKMKEKMEKKLASN